MVIFFEFMRRLSNAARRQTAGAPPAFRIRPRTPTRAAGRRVGPAAPASATPPEAPATSPGLAPPAAEACAVDAAAPAATAGPVADAAAPTDVAPPAEPAAAPDARRRSRAGNLKRIRRQQSAGERGPMRWVVCAGFVIFFVGFLGLAWPIGSWIFGFGTSPANDAARCVQLAGQQLARDDFSGAVASCDQALAVDPNFASAYMLRGNAELLQGLFTAAQADFREAQRLAPGFGYPLAGQAFLLALDGDFPKAERAADAALRQNDAAANAWMAKLYVHLSRGENQLAVEMYRQVLIFQEAPAGRQAVRDRLAETDELDLLGEMVWLMVDNHYRPLRRGRLALPAVEELVARTGRQSSPALAVLAAAYAAAGRFDDATATQTEALGLLDADAEASPAELAEYRRVLALYRGGLPYDEPAPAPAAVPDGDDEPDDESAPAR